MAMKNSKRVKTPRKPKPVALPSGGFAIVGVGASAGGLEAVTELLRHLPGGAHVALVVVQHLDPGQPSALTSLLSRITKLTVVETKNGIRVERGHVYVIPPNKVMGIARGILKLQPRATAAEPHAPVNFFFRALAEDQGARAIGIILSGTEGQRPGDKPAHGKRRRSAALGCAFRKKQPCKGETGGRTERCAAPSGLDLFLVRRPRALPWAGLWRTFGAQEGNRR